MRGAFCPELGGERLKGGRHLHRRVAEARDVEGRTRSAGVWEPESSAPSPYIYHINKSIYLLIHSLSSHLISPHKKKMIL